LSSVAKARWPDNPEAHAYDAAEVAADTRAHLIASGTSFVAETVFSHPSKLDLVRLAQGAEYQVVLHVMLVPEELAVRRVEYRVRAGGHTVPEHKIRERYHRVWPLAAEAILMADKAVVYDNSRPAGPSVVAEFVQGLPRDRPMLAASLQAIWSKRKSGRTSSRLLRRARSGSGGGTRSHGRHGVGASREPPRSASSSAPESDSGGAGLPPLSRSCALA